MILNPASWVIITDSNTCRIYEYNKQPVELKLIKELQHLENKLRDLDLISDKPGHYKSSNGAGGAYSQSTDPKEIKIDNFSREIAIELNRGRNSNAYKKLIIIAPAHMKGLLFHHIDPHVKNLVTHIIEKDVIHLASNDLLKLIKNHTKYSDEL